MPYRRTTSVVISIVSLVCAAPSAGASTHRPIVSSAILSKASRVATCEEGGWSHSVNGPTYFGSLGWLWSTWQRWRAPSFPVNMFYASPQQQSWAMAHFVKHELGGWWPDQFGCTGGY